MARKLKSDRMLFYTTIVLAFSGLVMVYSASSMLTPQDSSQSGQFLVKQLLFTVLGLAAMAVTMKFNYHLYRVPTVVWVTLGVTILALAAVLIVGPKINGTRRWFRLAGVGIQPSELAKIAMVMFAAAVLEQRMDRIRELRYALGPIAVALAVVVALILFEPDFGSAVAVLAVVVMMVFAAGIPIRYLALIGLGLAPLLVGVALWEPYRVRRFLIFLHPEQDPRGDGFQILQSLIAVGTGGVTGRGLGESIQKMFYLPYPHTDFIYAVTAEELGLIGASLMLACFAIVTWRGLRVASRAPDAFGSLLAIGLTAMIAVQAFVNISVVLGMMPTKGIPLPFVSAGGSSLIVSLAGMGMLLNISQQASVEG
ncbi:MAG: putative lipid II flippase FtsW [Acidobacteriota bacterium]